VANVVHYQLIRSVDSGPWTGLRRLVLRGKRHDVVDEETFEIGEPIQLANGPSIRHDQPHDAIWWIEGFEEWRGIALVVVNTRRPERRGNFPASEIQRLPALLRLAIESSGWAK
jgi:hypothetical protein